MFRMHEYIEIEGAHIHNLKNINIKIPRNKLTVVTGISGSGKSSLAFDIIYKEGKRRYLAFSDSLYSLESISSFDKIKGLSPTVALEQRVTRLSNPRSTVATRTKIDYMLSMLFSICGKLDSKYGLSSKNTLETFQRYSPIGMCGKCYGAGKIYSVDEELLFRDKSTPLHRILGDASSKYQGLYLFCQNNNLSYKQTIESLNKNEFDKYKYGDKDTNGFIGMIAWLINYYKQNSKTQKFDKSKFPFIEYIDCPECGGTGRCFAALNTKIRNKNIVQIENMNIKEIYKFFNSCVVEQTELFNGLLSKLKCMLDIGLGHIALSRSVPTLSGGEIQRLFLASYILAEMDSIVFIFDEPTIGLHEIEKQKLIDMLRNLVNRGNTVITVEHDKSFIEAADYIIDIGPYAGKYGGQCIFQGSYSEFLKCSDSITSSYFIRKTIAKNELQHRHIDLANSISLKHCCLHNLKNISINIPLGVLVGVAGVSGSGKSSLIVDTLMPTLKKILKNGFISCDDDDVRLNDDDLSEVEISGIENIKKCIIVNQQPIGRNYNSCLATYIGIFDRIRMMFASESGKDPGVYSTNSQGGCPDCKGNGVIRYNIGLEDFIDFECKTCEGTGFIKEALCATFDGKTIKEVLDMEVCVAIDFFKDKDKAVTKKLQMLDYMGLGYLSLGQKTPTISGGEAQRIKLAVELSKANKVKGNIYILDEPTTGLSMYDTENLINLLNKLVDEGASVLVCEHNTDLLSNCDYLIELDPRGGLDGGNIIATGTPNELKANRNSIIGRFLE